MGLKKEVIRCLIFDLDDTIFDTYGLLVKPATREACQAMIETGLNTTLEKCLAEREKIFLAKPRINVYQHLVEAFGIIGSASSDEVAQAGFDAFHDREIIEDIAPFDDTYETLRELKDHFNLTLVTLGTPKTQMRKVELLKLSSYFDSLTYVNVAREKTKTTAFKETKSKFPKLEAQAFVSIGNRIDGDIKNAKELGMQTVLMLHGEYAHLQPHSEMENPDASIKRLSELKNLLLKNGDQG